MTKRYFELWDLETRNLVDAFATEDEALAAVRDAYERHGEDYVLPWALARATQRSMQSLGEGKELIRRAFSGREVPSRVTGAAD